MSFDDKTKLKVWEKGHEVGNNDPKIYRKDDCGAWIKYSDYGNTDSQYGWEIDHITSKDHDGENDLSNLRPLQWQNNRSKGSGRLKCSVKAEGTKNIEIE